jgi:predicted transposase YdaD
MGKEEGLAEGEAKGKAEGLAEGKAEGIAEGLAEGEAKGRRETALVMLNKGLSLEMVSACTGLSMDEIKALTQ